MGKMSKFRQLVTFKMPHTIVTSTKKYARHMLHIMSLRLPCLNLIQFSFLNLFSSADAVSLLDFKSWFVTDHWPVSVTVWSSHKTAESLFNPTKNTYSQKTLVKPLYKQMVNDLLQIKTWKSNDVKAVKTFFFNWINRKHDSLSEMMWGIYVA